MTEKSFLSEITEEFRTTAEIVEHSQTVDFPDWRSPMMSSRCPFATGKSTSTTRNPVTTHGVFLERTKIEGDELSTSEILVGKKVCPDKLDCPEKLDFCIQKLADKTLKFYHGQRLLTSNRKTGRKSAFVHDFTSLKSQF